MTNIISTLVVLATSWGPIFAPNADSDTQGLITRILSWFENAILPIVGGVIAAVGLIKLIMAIVKFVSSQSEGEQQGMEKGKKSIIWSSALIITGLVIAVVMKIVGTLISSF